MGWKFEFGYTRKENIGSNGLSKSDLSRVESAVRKSLKKIALERGKGDFYSLDLPKKHEQAERCLSWASKARKRFDTFVLFGIGGSALGPRAIMDALRHPFHNMLSPSKRGGMRMFVYDNVDPNQLAGIFDVSDPERTVYNIVSKSGATAETAAAFMIVRKMIEKHVGKKALRKHMVMTTDPEKGELRKAARDEGFEAFDIPPEVGGRFSVLTPVGLLPAAAMGVNPVELLEGAAWASKQCSVSEFSRNPASLLAAIPYVFHTERKVNILVMMPYHRGLLTFAEWYQQLWAESLGKRFSRSGKEVHAGSTPVRSLGATDQHSQLQLYMEGPSDKLVIFLRVENPGMDVKIPFVYRDRPAMSYLAGHTLGELLRAEQEATAAALARSGRPNITISLDRLDAHALGALFYLFEIATIIAGDLYNVNPFDQPGVELGKVLTYGIMGRKGFNREKTAPKRPRQIRRN